MRRLPPEGGAFHPPLESAQQLATEMGEFSVVVSVGSGSITDIVKYARYLATQYPNRSAQQATADAPALVCFPTAASVTAYTSALAVLTVGGVKRTLDNDFWTASAVPGHANLWRQYSQLRSASCATVL